MPEEYKIPPFLNQIVIIAVIILAVIGMKYIAPIMGPVLISIFIAILIYPFLMWLKKKGFSYNISILITIVATFVLGAGLLAILVDSLSQLAAAAPNITIDPDSILATYANQIIQFLLSNIPFEDIAGIIEIGFFLLFAVIFLIYELPYVKSRLIKGFGKDSPSLKNTFDLIRDFIEYFVIRIKVNLFAAVGFFGVFLLFDINFAVLWGILTFVLGFIPYIGIMLAAIPPILIAWAKYGIWGALGITILFVIINTIAESFVFPKLTGKGLQISVYIVFISLFIWGWLMGLIGMFLAVPLTIVVIKYLYSFEETRWLALLMTTDGEEEKEEVKKEENPS
ncbi:MAG: AI-2E family transporter [Methanobacteriaceae archaeon]|jgi:predicted PurR-regulated permease PerM|nr:AI-2E family transporter [Methanobacteriaceae archaeon]MDP2836188.1 AI-2E family transporter [Methanobacteriaceae archaeon]MDP3035924.1 AI-2E family transporter [Methanobacteriaceae archaeon]MDP3484713.1 AI-2E family transporter [Methanobacteriaceae archaeon]MDP3624652.1 AI-2E family transporter [Methanobacteriaceae archaeon]